MPRTKLLRKQTMSSRLRRGRKNTMHNTEMIVGDITVEIMRKANLKNLCAFGRKESYQ